MLNLLIIDNNINRCKNLLNHISENNCQIRVNYILDNLDDGMEILNHGNTDIILINIDYTLDAIINTLNQIPDIYYNKYRKSVLLVTKHKLHNISNDYIFDTLDNDIKISDLISKIIELANNKKSVNNNQLVSLINKELKFIGYNLSYAGTAYIAESIALIYNNHGNGENLNNEIYPILAKKYNKTVNTIKCNIIKATDSMYYDCDETLLKTYFHFYTDYKPKPKLVIYTVLNKITEKLA